MDVITYSWPILSYFVLVKGHPGLSDILSRSREEFNGTIFWPQETVLLRKFNQDVGMSLAVRLMSDIYTRS